MRLLILTTGLVGLCASPVQARPTPSHSGVYDSVHIHQETGDLLGTWIEVTDGPAPKVTFQFCEGDCPEETNAPATIVGNRITFDHRQGVDGSITRATGRFTPKGLWLRSGAEADEAFVPRAKRPRGPH
jgi:hypothetical protein